MTDEDRAGEFGAIYLPALERIRNLWINSEPLVGETGFDDPLAPATVRIELEDGLDDAAAARIDVQWSVLDNYSFHYVDDAGVNWRFDRHPNTHSPDNHFHPPPDATTESAVPSCISVGEVSLVTRAVHVMWRAAYESGDVNRLNSRSNPP